MRPILFILSLLLSLTLTAQSDSKTEGSTPKKPALDDCPDFKKPKKNSRADYYEYLRNNRTKKIAPAKEAPSPESTPTVTDQNTSSSASTEVDRKEEQKKEFYASSKYNRTTNNKTEQKPPVASATTQPITPATLPTEEPAAPVAKADNSATPTQEKESTTPEEGEKKASQETASTTDDEAIASKNVKEKPSAMEKKVRRVFTKKNNKRAKPNYKKCSKF